MTMCDGNSTKRTRRRGRSRERTESGNLSREGESDDDPSTSPPPSEEDEDISHESMLWNSNAIVTAVLAAILAVLVSRFMGHLAEYWEELEEQSSGNIQNDQRRIPEMTSVVASDYAASNKPKIFHVSIAEENCHLGDDGCARLNLSQIITEEMTHRYQKDGVIAIRGLIPPTLLSSLDSTATHLIAKESGMKGGAMKRTGRKGQFHTVKMGAIYLEPPALDGGKEEHGAEGESAFRDVALRSAIPQVAAGLMGLTERGRGTMRMLRDVFLAKDDGEYCCGWHVDDYGFWPATPSSDGINAWIALDDMPIKRGGGFALAVGSHSTDWRMDAYQAVGSTHTYPPEGFRDAADMFENRTGAGTCNLATAAPELNSRMEASKRIYDIQAGDVIFHTRWLFHRTVPFERNVVHHWLGKYRGYRGGYESAPPPPLLHRRYSVRYAPGTAELPRGYGSELSILSEEKNAGKTLSDVSRSDGPWYPQCWPNVDRHETNQLATLVEDKLPVALERQKERLKEMRPYLDKIARQHQRARK